MRWRLALGAAALAGLSLLGAYLVQSWGPGSRPLGSDPNPAQAQRDPASGGPLDLVPARQASFIRDGDAVIGVELNGHATAYPVALLSYTEVVDDQVGGRPVVITW